MLTEVTWFGWTLHRLIHKLVLTTAHRAGERQGLWYSGRRSLTWPCSNSSFARLGRRYKWLVGIIYLALMHYSFVTSAPQPRRMSKTLILCLQFPIVTTTLWGQLAGKTMIFLPRNLLFYCTAMAAYVNQTPTFPPHYEVNVKVKSQHICQAIPALLRGLSEAVVTNDWCIINSLWCTSRENLVFSHPQIWHPLIYFSTYFQVQSNFGGSTRRDRRCEFDPSMCSSDT